MFLSGSELATSFGPFFEGMIVAESAFCKSGEPSVTIASKTAMIIDDLQILFALISNFFQSRRATALLSDKITFFMLIVVFFNPGIST